MADQASIYGGAIALLKLAPLATLTDDVPVRYAMDAVWGRQFIDRVLEQGYWHFASRSAKLDFDPGFTASFGYRYRFEKGSDWIRTVMTCSDEYFTSPITRIRDEVGSWFCDTTPLYACWVSNDIAYGGNLGAWPASFALFAEAEMALAVAPGLTASGELIKEIGGTDGSGKKNGIRHARLIEARSRAAMAESSTFLAPGQWVRSRYGRSRTWDRGSRSNLIG